MKSNERGNDAHRLLFLTLLIGELINILPLVTPSALLFATLSVGARAARNFSSSGWIELFVLRHLRFQLSLLGI